jgi:hypothetical protein
MVRLSLSLVLAMALTLTGVAIGFDAITQHDMLPLVGSALTTGLGLVGLRAVIKEWRAKDSLLSTTMER